MGNKIELTWYGKEEFRKIELRLLIENVKLSYGYNNDGIEGIGERLCCKYKVHLY